MGIKQELGKKIKRLRKSKGYTQEQFAEMIDISMRTLSGIEIGENFVTAPTLDRIILALDTTSEELFSSSHLKSKEELIDLINKLIKSFESDEAKLETAYKILSALSRE